MEDKMKKKIKKRKNRYYVFISIVLFIAQGLTYMTHFIQHDDLPFYNLASFIGYNFLAIIGVINLILAIKKEKPSNDVDESSTPQKG
jgi:hypothetical protein